MEEGYPQHVWWPANIDGQGSRPDQDFQRMDAGIFIQPEPLWFQQVIPGQSFSRMEEGVHGNPQSVLLQQCGNGQDIGRVNAGVYIPTQPLWFPSIRDDQNFRRWENPPIVLFQEQRAGQDFSRLQETVQIIPQPVPLVDDGTQQASNEFQGQGHIIPQPELVHRGRNGQDLDRMQGAVNINYPKLVVVQKNNIGHDFSTRQGPIKYIPEHVSVQKDTTLKSTSQMGEKVHIDTEYSTIKEENVVSTTEQDRAPRDQRDKNEKPVDITFPIIIKDEGPEEEEIYENQVDVKEELTIEEHPIDLEGDAEEAEETPIITTQTITIEKEKCISSTCGSSSYKKSHPEKHMKKQHNPEKPKPQHQCTKCGKKFIRPHNLQSHLKSHLEKKPLMCTVCHKIYSRADSLKRHTKTAHMSQSIYQCKICRMDFFEKDKIATHIQTQHCSKKNADLYERNVSKANFLLYARLIQHSKLHEGKQVHHCNECGMTFAQLKGLKIHLNVHKRRLNDKVKAYQKKKKRVEE